MNYYLTYLYLIFAPFLVALNPIFVGSLIFFSHLKIKLNLPFFLFISFILYDYMILFLLNLNIEFQFVIFQGFLLLIVSLYFFYFGLFRDRLIFIILIFLFLSSIQGVIAGSSIVSVVNFLKAMCVFLL